MYICEKNRTFAAELRKIVSENKARGMRITNPKIEDPILHMVGEEADRLGLSCYVIGGWVRDLILHRPSTDIDIVVARVNSEELRVKSEEMEQGHSGIGIKIAEAVAKRLGRKAHLSVFKTYGTAQVKWRGAKSEELRVKSEELKVKSEELRVKSEGVKEIELEFVGARRESYHHDSRNPIVEDGTLQEDQNRRDFTINAMAICLNRAKYGELVDPFDGMGDLERCIIRTPLDPDITFSDDPLRMMRAIRFATQLGFNLDGETYDAICRNRERIRIITRERINDELHKIMLSRRPSEGWLLLDKTGLLPLIFPELAALKGVEVKSGRGHKDVFLHTLQVVDNLAELTSERMNELTNERKDKVLWLRWAALLHDIGKPRSKQWDPQAGWTFRNHNYIGAKMIPKIFRTMKLPLNEKMQYVQKMVDLHMRPINLIEDTVTDSAVRRLLFEAGDDIEDLMLLCDADITSRNEEKVARYHRNYQLVREKMVELEERDRIRNFQPPVRGEEIMQLLHLEPCSMVGELKSAIKDAILDGVIPNEHEAAKAYLMQLAMGKGLLKVES